MSNEEQQSPDDVEVRLRPVLGLAPRTYVPIVYGVLILVVLFFVLVFPGIRHHGAIVTFVTTPRGASVRVDGSRIGSAPGSYFVRSGAREIEVLRPGFEPYRDTLDVPGRLLGSWIAPRRLTLGIDLDRPDLDALVGAAAIEFSSWALTGEASGQYQFPPIARALASDLRPSVGSTPDASLEAWRMFVDSALPQVASEALLNDLVSGALSLGGETAVAVPSGIAEAVQQLARSAADAELLPLQIAAALSPDRRAIVSGTGWGEDATVTAQTLGELRLLGSGELAGARTEGPLGLSFVAIAGGTAVLGGEARAARGGDVPHRVTVEPYSVALTETPYSAYRAFLNANPEWTAENRTDLAARDLVDDDYLGDLDRMEANPNLPVTGVSAYAAAAFAEWYTTLLPSGMVARLPSENEWDFALVVSGQRDGVFASEPSDGPLPVTDSGVGRAGIAGLVGNVWEWTSDSFALYSFVYRRAPALPAVHRVVRGGGWATESVGFQIGDRGSMAPEWCSPFVGFRIVISPARR